MDLLGLNVRERAGRVLLDDLVELGGARVRELPAHGARCEGEELVLLGHSVDLAAREPAGVAPLRGLGRVLAVLLGDLGEVGAAVDRGLRRADLLEGVGEVRRHLARRRRHADQDVEQVDLLGRRRDRLRLRDRGVVLAEQVVLRVLEDLALAEAACEPASDERICLGPATFGHLDHVVAEVRLHRLRDLADLQLPRGLVVRRDELPLTHPSHRATGVFRPGVIRLLREPVPEVLAVRIGLELLLEVLGLRERGRLGGDLIGRGVVDLHEDVARVELAEVVVVARAQVGVGDRVAVAPRDGVEERLLGERVDRDAVVVGLLLCQPGVVLEARRDAVVLVELHELVVALVVVEAVREDVAVDERGRPQIGVVVPVRARPDHQSDGAAEQHREHDDDDRLLSALALPAGFALALGQSRERDAACHEISPERAASPRCGLSRMVARSAQ